MAQKISIKIAGRMFNLTVNTPEDEELYRLAAENINQRFASYARNLPGKNASDLLSMIALHETVIRLSMQQDLEQFKDAEKSLAKDLENYLKDNGTQ